MARGALEERWCKVHKDSRRGRLDLLEDGTSVSGRMQLFTAVGVIFALLQVARAQPQPLASASASTSADLRAFCSTPSTVSGFENAALPDPFLFNDGTRVKTVEDWSCRRAQILALTQGYESGTLPGPPRSLTAKLTKSGTAGNLTITARNGDTSITFTPTITFPSGEPPVGGWPLVIAYDGLSIPVPSNVSHDGLL